VTREHLNPPRSVFNNTGQPRKVVKINLYRMNLSGTAEDIGSNLPVNKFGCFEEETPS
jgi:hypothetical protein